jgi:peptide/nickel transport system permease protein
MPPPEGAPPAGSRRLVAWTGGMLLLMVLLAAASPLLPLPDPGRQDLRARLAPPVWAERGTWAHPLGTDQLGRDLAARLCVGARLTLIVAASAVALGAAGGTLLGLLAGYHRGWTDLLIARLVDAQLSIPFILLAIAIISVRGRSLPVLVGVLAVVGWARYARIIRGEALALRERPFVYGLKAAGVPATRILGAHLLPNVLGTLLVLATLEVGTMILAESALSFLGLGVVSPDISWGAMLAEGRDYMGQAWWLVAFPGAAITLTVVLVNFLGDGLRARFDPRRRGW